jgi:TP901 family phage tail tape measure protein
MNVLGYVTEATGATMQEMSDLALQLGADTVFSANEAAAGMVELAKAGMDTEEVMDSISGVMDLAAAGAMGVEEAAGLTAATLNTFGLEASKSAEVADILAAAANASSADVRDLAFGVQNAGSVFAASGQSIDSLATMMALMANNGLNASDAATSLKTMTMRLTAPTGKAANVMEDLGLAIYDTDGNMRDFHDIIQDLEGATKGLSDEQRNAAFSVIFGADAIRAANILVAEGVTGYEEMNAKVLEQGAAAQMAAAQNSGLAGAMEQISGSFETLATKLALPFMDDIAAGIDQVTELVNKFGELPQPVQDATLGFLGFSAALGAALLVLGGAAAVIGTVSGPVGLVALALLGAALAVAALKVAWETNWGDIQGKTETALAAIQPLIDAFAASMTTIGTAASDIGTKFSTAFEEADFPTFDELFADLLEGDFGSLTTKLQAALDKLALELDVTFKITPFIEEQKRAAVKASDLQWENLGAVPQEFAAAMNKEMLAHPWEAEGETVGKGMATGIAAGIGAAITAWGWASEMDKQLRVESKGFKLDTFIGGIVAEIQSGFKPEKFEAESSQISTNAITSLTSFMGGVTRGIVEGFKGTGIDEALAQFDKDNAADLNTIGESLTTAGATLSAAMTTFRTNIETGIGTLSTAFGTAWTTLTTALETLKTNISTMFTGLGETISGALTTMVDTVKASIAGLFGGGEPVAAMTNGLNMGSPEVDWGDMPEFVWPALPPFTWPAYLPWDWLEYDPWVWPSPDQLYAWDWPNMSMPGWVGTLISALGGAMSALGGGGGGSASGGGAPPLGSPGGGGGGDRPQDLNPEDFFGMSASSQGASAVTINVFVDNVNNGMDIEVLAAQLARRFQQKMRA